MHCYAVSAVLSSYGPETIPPVLGCYKACEAYSADNQDYVGMLETTMQENLPNC